jgi:hypothetical protein
VHYVQLVNKLSALKATKLFTKTRVSASGFCLATEAPHSIAANKHTKHRLGLLYVQVTVHRDNLRINNQQDASSIQNFGYLMHLVGYLFI